MKFCIAVIQLYVYIYMRKYNQQWWRTNTLLKNIPLTLYSRKGCERVVCERWVGDGTDCNILTPSSPHHFFLILLSCSTGVLRGQSLCLELVLTASNSTATDSNKPKPSVAPGYIIIWHPPASCGRCNCTEFNPYTGKGDTLISSTGCTCFLIDGCLLIILLLFLWMLQRYSFICWSISLLRKLLLTKVCFILVLCKILF